MAKPTRLSNLVVKGEVLTYAKTLTQTDVGKTFFLNSTSEFITTLPLPKKGMFFQFIVKAAPVGWDYVIKAKDSADIIDGQVYTVDVDSATDPDFEITGNNTIHFVAAKSVVGDRIDLVSDGTYWYASCFCSVYDAITFLANSSVSSSISKSISSSVSPSAS
jgi:hypothetical protein